MSAVFIFEIKGAKKDKIFNFLKGRFSVMGGLMDMIFGVFSETYVRLLTSITSQFLSRRAALEPQNYIYLIQLYKFSLEWS